MKFIRVQDFFYSPNRHYIARRQAGAGRGLVAGRGRGRPGQAGEGPRGRQRPGPPGKGLVAGRGRGRRGRAKKIKKKVDTAIKLHIIGGVARGKRPSRDTAAKLCHKVWLFFDNLIKRRLCYGT